MKKIRSILENKERSIFIFALLLICVWTALHFVHVALIPKINVNYDQGDLKFLEREDGTGNYYIKEQQAYFDDAVSVNYQYTTPEISLSSGTYEVTVEYDAESDNFGTYVYAHSPSSYHNLISDTVVLYKSRHSVTYQIEVKHSLNGVQVRVNCPDDEEIAIHSVSVKRTHAGERKFVCQILILLIVVCILHKGYLCYLNQRIEREQIAIGFFLIIAGLWSSILVFRDGMIYGDDLAFHLWRIEGIKTGLLNGDFPVRLHTPTLNGYGYATPLYYGEALLYIPAVLRMIGYSIETAFKTFVVMINLATIFSAYFCLKKIFQNRELAAFGSVLYTFATYRLVDIYVRAAVGEYCAMIFIPIVCYALWLLYHKKDQDLERKDCIPLVIGLTGLLQTHILMTILSAVMIIVFVLICYKKTFQKNRFWVLAKSVLYTILINAWFIIPFLCSYFKENLIINAKGDTVQYIQEQGVSLFQMIATAYSGQHSDYQYSMSLGAETILLLSVVVFWILYFALKKENAQKNLWRAGKVCSILAILFAFASTDIMPYNYIFENITLLNKLFGMIQFPWRFYTFTNLLLSLEWVIILKILKERIGQNTYWVVIAVLSAIVMIKGTEFMGELSCNQRIVSFQDMAALPIKPIRTISAGEYLPIDTNQEELVYSDQEIYDDDGVVQSYIRKDNSYELECINQKDTTVYCEVALLYYRNYMAYDKATGKKLGCHAGNNNRICVEVPEAYEGTICIKYQIPWYWRGAEGISLISCVCLLIFGLKDRRRWG